MTSLSSLRVRLAGTVFLAVVAALFLLFGLDAYLDRARQKKHGAEAAAAYAESRVLWTGFAVGLVALGAAWYGGERFILRQVRMLSKAAQQLGAGDFASRTGLAREKGELGELARSFDSMAVSLEQRVREREQTEKALLNRAFQQTVVGALGQFAISDKPLNELLNQVVMLVAQTLEVEYCCILEQLPGGRFLLLRAGIGWKPGCVGKVHIPADPNTEAGFALRAGEPVVASDARTDKRFRASSLLVDHGVVSGVTVAVTGHAQAFGLLGTYTTKPRAFSEDEVHFLFSVATVLAMAVEKLRAEVELRKHASFARLNPNPAMEITGDGAVTYSNDAARRLAQSLGQTHASAILPSNIFEAVTSCLTAAQPIRLETQVDNRTLRWAFYPVLESQAVHCYVEDTTEELSLKAQLFQAQKMESIGQLAAGVAHDFNNMLTVIQGHSGILLARQNLPPELLDSSQAIYFAAERAASLTRQLLMFSRKNVMQIRALDLREVVKNMSKMLQRLIGETVVLEFHPPPAIPLMDGDPGMVEQVLMNLSVNARDAMPKGGRLTVTTDPVIIGTDYLHTHPEARAGAFVRLRVADTGSGMDAATMARIFEPFFTTKEVGKGTGLGLATVYGIVKQHEGWVEVNSEIGRGTVFSVYFPASDETAASATTTGTPAEEVQGGKETILVVEDEEVLRDLAHLILSDCGYTILEASSGVQAMQVWHEHQNSIDLVLTDMVMPEGMSGMELAQQIHAQKPGVRIIFASGYSMDDMDNGFLDKANAAFLQKPYTHISLAKAVRECLDKPVRV
jgi:signal transduction histidine kinase/CheY-like chemotaxis protein/HAMP domain-containing protein